MRTWFAMVVGCLALTILGTGAHAETLGIWTYTPPEGYEAVKKQTQHEYTRANTKTFCVVAVFVPRPAGADLASDLRAEWKSAYESKFTATNLKTHPVKKLKSGLTRHVMSAEVSDESGTYYGELAVIRERGAVGSILLMSSSQQTIAGCYPAMGALLESIAFAAGPEPAPAPAPAPSTSAPAAATLSIVGTWSAGTSATDARGVAQSGSTKKSYWFNADGTYRFYREAWGGQFASDSYWLTNETGTYTLTGDTLVLTPKKVTGTLNKGGRTSSFKPPVEKMTYTVKKHYFSGLQEWNLVMTPAARTDRDGAFVSNPAFPGSYLYRDQYQPGWRFPP
ncbi:MAG: lipocalin family protein [Kofleriaceae bacterium]|nr:lipocalin family protein [Kofleriaceae bacterium]